MTFEELKLTPELLRALADCGYTEPTPIRRKPFRRCLLAST